MILANLADFIKRLYEADQSVVKKVKKAGCLYCGSILDIANYPRKLRGVPAELEKEMAIRFSLCCRKTGCRKRSTPKSLRFYGSKVYWLYVIILAVLGLMVDGAAVARKTTRRWKECFSRLPESRCWREKKALFMPPLDESCLLSALVEKFTCRDGPSGWIALFELLNPFCTEIVGDMII